MTPIEQLTASLAKEKECAEKLVIALLHFVTLIENAATVTEAASVMASRDDEKKKLELQFLALAQSGLESLRISTLTISAEQMVAQAQRNPK